MEEPHTPNPSRLGNILRVNFAKNTKNNKNNQRNNIFNMRRENRKPILILEQREHKPTVSCELLQKSMPYI